LTGHDGETSGLDYRGTNVVMSYRYLPDAGGGCIVANLDEAAMLMPARHLRYEMVGIAIILVLAATFGAVVLTQRVIRPLQQLTDRARRLQRGDFDSTISIRGPAEIETFATTFAAMVASLKRSREQERIAQEKLMQSEKIAAAGRLAATVAHEVNNPLSAAMNSLFLLRDKVSDTGRQLLDGAEEQLKRVAGITRQTLGFYRENASKIDFDLQQVVVELVATFTPRARNKDIEIVSEVSPMQVHAVKGEIQQVIANLLTNAIDASPAKTKVRVRARRFESAVFGDVVQISVGDSGAGIPPEFRDKIWEPFFTTKEGVGTGLGLWVCRQIVQRHHGIIRAHSTHEGTVFTVILPQRAAETQKAAG
jgi:signal transduction histidine kinase